MLPLTIARTLKTSTSPAKLQISAVGIAGLLVCLAVGAAGSVRLNNPVPAVSGALLGLHLLFAIRVAEQWERAAVLRFGRYIGLRGPGIFMIVPVIDQISQYVDQRVRVVQVSAETALTRDTVPVNVDAIVFRMGLECGEVDSGSGQFQRGHHDDRADGAAGIDRAARSGADDHQSRDAGTRVAAHFG
jgi:hypothetical protein